MILIRFVFLIKIFHLYENTSQLLNICLNYNITLPTSLINGELDAKKLLAKNEVIRWSLQYSLIIT